jgi:hypothetical protein
MTGLLLVIVAPCSIAMSETVNAITVTGSGTLTKCRSWLVFDSCKTHRKVSLPQRVAVGDNIELSYGSNPKNYVFNVVRIDRQGQLCTVLSDASGVQDGGEKIEITECQVITEPAILGSAPISANSIETSGTVVSGK